MSQSNLEQRVAGVRALFNPRNIAIVGASDRPGNWSQRVYRSLKQFDFPGAIYAVNPAQQDGVGRRDLLPEPARAAGSARPRGGDRAGRRRHRRPSRKPARPRRAAPPCSPAASAKAAIRKGRALGGRSQRAIDSAGLAVSGPNCMGNLAAPHRLMTIPDDRITELERGPVGDRRPERRHRDGDPPRAARARRHRRLRGDQRQRDRPQHGGLHPLSRRRSRSPRDRLLHRVDQGRRRVSPRLRICARCRQAGRRGQDRRLRGEPQGRARAHRLARGLARNASTRSPRRSAWCASTRSTRSSRRSNISPMPRRRRARGSAP